MSTVQRRPQVGELAPAIELLDHEGKHWCLADYVGDQEGSGPVVLIFHRHIH